MCRHGDYYAVGVIVKFNYLVYCKNILKIRLNGGQSGCFQDGNNHFTRCNTGEDMEFKTAIENVKGLNVNN